MRQEQSDVCGPTCWVWSPHTSDDSGHTCMCTSAFVHLLFQFYVQFVRNFSGAKEVCLSGLRQQLKGLSSQKSRGRLSQNSSVPNPKGTRSLHGRLILYGPRNNRGAQKLVWTPSYQ